MKQAPDLSVAGSEGVRLNMDRCPSISVIVPAFNEERYLGATLRDLRSAAAFVTAQGDAAVDILVVDNASTDGTAEVAKAAGASVVSEREHNIARVRNAGARASRGDVLVFVDADTATPPELLFHIAQAMGDPTCTGGAVDVVFEPGRLVLRAYLRLWRWAGAISGAALGACQFCRRDAFEAVGGYDETIYVGEDTEFMWRLRRAARGAGGTTRFLRDIRVVASSRRWDSWPLWRTLVMTHPLVVFPFWRRRAVWRGWYDEVPR